MFIASYLNNNLYNIIITYTDYSEFFLLQMWSKILHLYKETFVMFWQPLTTGMAYVHRVCFLSTTVGSSQNNQHGMGGAGCYGIAISDHYMVSLGLSMTFSFLQISCEPGRGLNLILNYMTLGSLFLLSLALSLSGLCPGW